ncbi:hypothetical protein D3C80_1688160 [compost metagenome]
MGDVVLAAAQRTLHPGIHQFHGQRRVHANGGMQAGCGLPCPVAHGADRLADVAGGLQRHRTAIDGHLMAIVIKPGDPDLQTFDG